VVTYNLHKGKNFLGKSYNIHRLKEMLNEQSYDIGLFQEVLGNHRFDKNIASQINLLTDESWKEHSFAKNSIVNNFEHGNSITSRHTIVEERILDLTVNSFEKRSALLSLIDFDSFKVQCICTHLNLLQSDRIKQAKMLVNFIKNNEVEGIPIILGGDLNDRNGDITKLLITEAGFSTPKKEHLYPTFPSFLPFLGLDRILCKNIEVVTSEIGRSSKYKTYSDHLPLFYELELSTK